MDENDLKLIEVDAAAASWRDLVDCADICIAIWPSDGASAEKSARSSQQRQAAGEFKPGDTVYHFIRDVTGERVVAHAQSFAREISIDGQRLTILGIGGVCTRPEYRKHGLGSKLVRACFARVDRGNFPYCLFQTSHANRPFYERLGSQLLHNRFVNSLAKDPEARPFWDDIVMAYPASRPFPEGTVDLLGPGY